MRLNIMRSIFNAAIILVIVSLQNHLLVTCDDCPDPKLLEPCYCNQSAIVCDGNESIDLETVFERLSDKLPKRKKQFDELVIKNQAITELKENFTKDIKFHTIFISKAYNLRRIDANAFRGTAADTKIFVLKKCYKFDSLEVFDLFNNLENIETINIGALNVSEVPSKVFRAHKTLHSFTIHGESVQQIGEQAFHALNQIKFIDIINTSISHIPANVFTFDKSEARVQIGLFYNQLDGNGFSADAFANIGRPADIHYMGHIDDKQSDRIKFLDQKAFEPFLSSNAKNHIVLKYEVIDCNDCRNLWLKKNQEFGRRVHQLRCSNGRTFDSSDNFANCAN